MSKVEVEGSRLLYRWFVEYNPLYLLSAALVLVGVSMLSSALAGQSFLLAQLGVPVVAEIYGWALIGGAALLMRIELRRPAVMLTMLAALYQCDVTLHTVSSVYLGTIGLVAGLVWWLSFVAKLHAMAWAMRIRASRSSHAVPSVGALGLFLVPQVLRRWGPDAGHAVAALWAFGVVGAALWTRRTLLSEVPLNPWGQAVLRRSRRALWAIWATAAIGHFAYWTGELGLSAGILVPVALVLVARFVGPPLALGVMTAVVGFTALEAPTHVSTVSVFVALALALRAWREPVVVAATSPSAAEGPYRATRDDRPPRFNSHFVIPSTVQRLQLVSGALFALYTSVWTLGWTGGSLPNHVLWLDVLFSALLMAMLYRWRYRPALVPLASIHVHHGVAGGLLALPATLLGWGMLSVGTGFALLVTLVAVALFQRRPQRASDPATTVGGPG